jgi:hypothetical protein
LEEELLYDDKTSSGRNSENESQISASESNWIQIQTERHKKVTDKPKDWRETWLKTRNRSQVSSNLKETIKPTEVTKEETLY